MLHFFIKTEANYFKFQLNTIHNFLLIIIESKFLTKAFYIIPLIWHMILFQVESIIMHKFSRIYYIN